MGSRNRQWLDTRIPVSRHILVAVAAVVVYLLTDRAVVVLQFWPGTASLYLPAGITIALLVGLGPGHAVTAFIAMMIAAYVPDRSPVGWLRVVGWAAGVTTTYATTAWILRTRTRFDPAFRRFRDAVRFSGSFLLASLVAAVLVAAIRAWGSDVALGDVAARATAFWIGDAAAILSVTPFLLLWVLPWLSDGTARPVYRPRVSRTELVLQAVSVLVVVAVIGPAVAGRVGDPALFLLFLPMVWIASRSGVRTTSAASTVLIIGATTVLAGSTVEVWPHILVASSLVVLSGIGLLLGVLVTERDRTLVHLRQREQNLARAEGVARLGSWTWDVPADECVWSDGLYHIHDRPSDRGVTATTYLDYVVDAERDAVASEVGAALQERRGYTVEYTAVTENGQRRRIRAQAAVELEEGTGQILRVTGTCQDITEALLAEEQALRTRRLELLGRLAADVAHDFNNFLTVIQGRASLIEDDGGTTDDGNLAEIRRTVDIARTLNQQLLAFARGDSLEPETVDISGEIQSHEWIFRRMVGDKVSLAFDLAQGLPAITIVRVRLEQVVNNLVANADDAVPDGGTITVRTRTVPGTAAPATEGIPENDTPPPPTWVVLDVVDDGIGMSPETAARIFDPFFTTKTYTGGTGLGLAMVDRIVRDCGGRVQVDSGSGEGTTISVFLPPAS